MCDGKTPGITMPSPESQYAGIQRAYKVAGLDPKETAYVEAHGTYYQSATPAYQV